MTTSNAAEIENATQKPAAEKVHEKLTEKRRALGRGLESLLPGPRVVPTATTLPQSTLSTQIARKDAPPAPTPAGASSNATSGVVTELQAAAAGPMPGGEHAFEL